MSSSSGRHGNLKERLATLEAAIEEANNLLGAMFEVRTDKLEWVKQVNAWRAKVRQA